MRFVWDPKKSEATKKERGFDFSFASRLWDDEDAVIVPARVVGGERRLQIIGMIDGKHYTAIFLPVSDETRIISARRARKEEIAIYG